MEGKGGGERKALIFYNGEIALVATVQMCHILLTGDDLSCIPRLLMVT